MIPQPTTKPTARKPGRGRPALIEPRRTTLPRVSASAHARLHAYAQAHQITLADALQAAILALPDLQRSTASNPPSKPTANKKLLKATQK
jgi:hypothetical protein